MSEAERVGRSNEPESDDPTYPQSAHRPYTIGAARIALNPPLTQSWSGTVNDPI